MITAGVDCGAKNVKIIILNDRRIIGKHMMPVFSDTRTAVQKAYSKALTRAGITEKDVQRVISTGAGKKEVVFASGEVNEVSADAKGITFVIPDVRTVFDVGAEEGRIIRVLPDGTCAEFAINERCAAGTGTFIETLARIFEVDIDAISDLYFQSTKEIPMNAQCAVFAESEIVAFIHNQTPKPYIVRSVINAIADRIVSMLKMIGVERDVAAIGGVSLNKGFIDAVEKKLKVTIAVPDEPQFIGAIGAALIAEEL